MHTHALLVDTLDHLITVLRCVHEIPGPITRVLHCNLTRRSVSKRTAWSRARLHLIGYTPAGRGRLLADLYH